MQKTDIAIVGGGIWGLSTAYHLAQLGQKRITVLERNPTAAAETTSQAAGLVGQIHLNSAMLGAVQYALALFTQFSDEMGYDTGLHQTGSLMIALTPERMAAYTKSIDYLNQNSIEAYFVDQAEMKRLAPALEPDTVEGAFFIPSDGYVDPSSCAQAFLKAAKALGVEIECGVTVADIELRNGRAVGLNTDQGFVEANQVIVTAGPWVGRQAKKLGLPVAAQTIRHQRVRTAPVDNIPEHHPVVRFTDLSCYWRPEKGGYTYGFFEPNPTSIDLDIMIRKFGPGFGTSDIEPPLAVMIEAQKRLTPFAPLLERLEIVERYQGMTTFAPDGAYLLGPVPDVDNLFLATACAALGIAGSAAIGRWLANWVVKGHPGETLPIFAFNRFGDRSRDQTWIRQEGEHFYADYYGLPR